MSEFSSSIIFVVPGLGATLLKVVFTKLQALEISSHGISPDMAAGGVASTLSSALASYQPFDNHRST